MNTTDDYIHWRSDIPFSKCSINEIDALIFVLLSNIEYIYVFKQFYLDKQILLPEIVYYLSKFGKKLKSFKDLCKFERLATADFFYIEDFLMERIIFNF